MSITPAIVREHIETDLDDAALQRFIDDAEADIARFAGETSAVTETHYDIPGATVWLYHKAASITSVTADGDAVPADDYQLRFGGMALYSVAGGWAQPVTLVYTPAVDTVRADRVAIDLVRLAIQYDATRSHGVGDYTQANVEYERERRRLLSSLVPAGAFR